MNPRFVRRVTCPVCESSDSQTLFRCPYGQDPIRSFIARQYANSGAFDPTLLEGADYVLCDCPRCRLVFQEYVPDDQLSEIIYEKWLPPEDSFEKKERRASRVRGRATMEVLAVVDHFGRPAEELRVLDFGMGWGNWCRMAKAIGCDAVGLERSPARLAHAQRLGLNVIGTSDLDPEQFDFINTEQVFEHLNDPLDAARTLARSLRPGGVLKLSVPNGIRVRRRLRTGDWSAPKGSRRSLYDVTPLQHVNCFVYRSLDMLASRVGLRPVARPAGAHYRYAPTWEPAPSLLKRTVGAHVRHALRQSSNVWFTPAT
jgi:SAM-dependent methyltransferase